MKALFNQSPENILLSTDSLAPKLYRESIKDTLKLWYNPALIKNPWQIILQSGINSFDTLKFNVPASTQNVGNLSLENTPESGISRPVIKPGEPIPIFLSRPVFSADASKIIQIKDSISLSDTLYFEQDTVNPRKISLYGRWQEGNSYKLNMPPGTIQDIYGRTTDSLKFTVSIGKTEDYGNLAVKFSALDSTIDYVIQIVDDSQRLFYENHIHGKRPENFSLKLLQPGKYTLKVIKDENNNGIWDTGNLLNHRQPEKIALIPIEEIKANWDVETSVDLIEIFRK